MGNRVIKYGRPQYTWRASGSLLCIESDGSMATYYGEFVQAFLREYAKEDGNITDLRVQPIEHLWVKARKATYLALRGHVIRIGTTKYYATDVQGKSKDENYSRKVKKWINIHL